MRPSSAPHAPSRPFFSTHKKFIYIRNNCKYPITIVVTNNPRTIGNKVKHLSGDLTILGNSIKGEVELFDNHKDIIFFKSFKEYHTGTLYVDLSTFYIHVLVRLENGDYINVKKEAYERNYYEYIIDDDDIVNVNGEIVGKYIKTKNEINKLQLLGQSSIF